VLQNILIATDLENIQLLKEYPKQRPIHLFNTEMEAEGVWCWYSITWNSFILQHQVIA